ncbi:PGF-pre-PGF domain-containing protein [Candidatus Woesearchaeota archaeon]|nr:PGF-pre-PGF domain-containing protein [Candidatus Woesearchaeota archaeon]
MMKKEGHSAYFNSQDGKVNVMLLISVVLIFVIMMISAEALTIKLISPGNLTYNGTNTRNVNFTFTANWTLNTEAEAGNCSIWINSTNPPNAWQLIAVNSSQSNITNFTIGGPTLVSWINYTFTSDGNYTWSVGCTNASGAGDIYTFPVRNNTFFIDTVAPEVRQDSNDSNAFIGILGDGTAYNITSYSRATLYINVTDNSTKNVFMILNSGAFIAQTVAPNTANDTINYTMVAGTSSGFDKRQYYFNLSGILNFSGSFASPGPHSVFFCANDSLGRITCSNRSDFVIMGMNVTLMENMFTTMQQFDGAGNPVGPAFGGMNITFGNGSEIPTSTFMNPVDGVSFGGQTQKNFTFIINISPSVIVHIVAGRVDANQFANASRTKANSTPSAEVQQQLGTGFSAQLGWVDIASFIPSEVSYEFGILQLGGIGYSKKMYCNGTTVANPLCHLISQCNASVFTIYNHTAGQTSSSPGVIPTNDACWLETGTINGQALKSGFTYIFVDHFSGGLGGSDFSQINSTFHGSLSNYVNTTTALHTINFTLDDINSTGLNLTMNNSINLTLILGGSVVAFFNFTNSSITDTRLSCTTSDLVSKQNTTSVTCNASYAFSNGTYSINVTARDTSNNTNPVNLTTSAITVTIDQIPPVLRYFNITNSSILNHTVGIDVASARPFDKSNAGSARQGGPLTKGGQNRTILFVVANFTENLTSAFQAAFQFYNITNSSWQTLNTTPVNERLYNISGLANFSFPIPQGHNEFEGANVSFIVIANDTLGNTFANYTHNITVQINDTTPPTITINGTIIVNNTNTSNTLPLVSWSVVEGSSLLEINVSVDGVVTDDGCNKFKRFTTTVNEKRNDSFTPTNSPSCTLVNGTHFIEVKSRDTWGNVEISFHNFTVQSGSTPGIRLTALQNGLSVIQNGLSANKNQSNVTPYTGINFSAFVGNTGTLKNITFYSSCNSTEQAFAPGASIVQQNLSYIWPFNYTDCKNREANQTVTVTVFDTAGNSVTNTTQFFVDDLGPTISVNAPANGFTGANNILINVSAKDAQMLSKFVYYLDDGINSGTFTNISNSTPSSGAAGTNITHILSVNFTAGTHTIKFAAFDTAGGIANGIANNSGNGSVITITVTGSIPPASLINTSIRSYLINTNPGITFNTTLRLKDSSDAYTALGANATNSNQTYEIQLLINNTINVTITEINGSGANWNKINFSVKINESTVRDNIQTNWSNRIRNLVFFNSSIDEFVPSPSDYYGIVELPMNVSGGLEIWWISNESNLGSKTNVSRCTSAFTAATETPCFNFTSGGKTIVNVPHFSIVVVSNDSNAPTINVTTPDSNNGTGISMFVPNITVSNDATLCEYSINGTEKVTMTKSGTVCLGQTERFKNLAGVNAIYNFTFNVTDSSSNVNTYIFRFNVSDATKPNSPNASRVSPTSGSVSGTTSTSITVGDANADDGVVGVNETFNVTLIYGTAIGTLSSTAMETDFNASQSVSLTGLSASTLYYFNVSVCDFNGNCATNGTFNFTTSAVAVTGGVTSDTGGGTSGGGAAPPSNVEASAGRQWDTLAAGSSGVLTVNNEKIAVTGVIIDVKNPVTSASITVESFTSNPLSASAAAKTYQYLQLKKSNIADTDTSKITVNFRVPKSWLSTNGVAEGDVVLYRYSDSTWNALSTTMTGSDANNALYSAVTPGFSTFAIGSKEAAPEAAQAETPAEVPAAEIPAPTAEAETAAVPEAAMEKKGLSTTAIAWIVVLAIVVVAAVGYFMMQKKKAQ